MADRQSDTVRLLWEGLQAVCADEWQPREDCTLEQVLDAVRAAYELARRST